jgi:hypothetical protein
LNEARSYRKFTLLFLFFVLLLLLFFGVLALGFALCCLILGLDIPTRCATRWGEPMKWSREAA